ncbi:MAG TPA: D-aminoacyl-tRNA deacylase [Actinomycetales bacterium]|nr:D-aminoacyl-tRNA deacylase [Actinomycetales bacterium]
MRAVVQRSDGARVIADGVTSGEFSGPGLVVLLGITHDDGPEQITTLARKVAHQRILRDEKSAVDIDAPVLVISQFTLYADTKKGRRPSWSAAAPREVAEGLVAQFVEVLREEYALRVETGVFGADMRVELVNDGPVTLILEA